ncbi:MAG: serine/threonine protein kinase [Deltaproteobacteria bacterium]|nr:serine/threonine protein kinase [Deltaproteobacteria bacterium]MBI3296236.1 serine/threonine protein kinase [Deltaproteobacteria bacterium]
MQEFHDFELVRELGRGGTAITQLVRDRASGELLARKILQSTQRDRFEREIAILSALSHPQIAGLRYANLKSVTGEPPSLFMDFIDGETLDALHHRLPYVLPEVSVLIIAELLKALEYAHGKGVVHRDLKPANILLDPSGKVVLVDFGLAVARDLTRITQTTGVVGTFDYLAPEQLSGDQIDVRTDLFATGVILYYLVTGTLPFGRHSVAATLNAIQNDPIEPAFRRNPKVSRELWLLMERALAKRPDERFQSAREMKKALDRYLEMIGFTSGGWTLRNWIESPSAAIMDRLEICAEHITASAEALAKSGKGADFSSAVAHLTLKAPQSPAIDRLMKTYELCQRGKVGRRVAGAAAIAMVLVAVVIVTWRFGRPTELATQASLAVRPAVVPAIVDKTVPELPILAVGQPAQPVVRSVAAPGALKTTVRKEPLAKASKISASPKGVAPQGLANTPELPKEIFGVVKFSVPDGTRVFWDGRKVDPKAELNREPLGSHALLLERDGSDPIRAEVKVAGKEPTVIEVGTP